MLISHHHHHHHHYHQCNSFCHGKVIREYVERRKRQTMVENGLLVRFPEWSGLSANGCIHLQSFKYVQTEQWSSWNPYSWQDIFTFVKAWTWKREVWLALMGYSIRSAKERKDVAYLVNWRSLASMLRCLMHILVRAEPMSLVAPGNTKQPAS